MEITEVPDFDIYIRQFVNKNDIVLYILTPCYGASCSTHYVNCLLETIKTFEMFNIKLKIQFCNNDSLVTRARNNLIARAMTDPTTTHMLFIDADIIWNPYDIIKMLMNDKHIVGGAYPYKSYNWGKLSNPETVKNWIDKKNNSVLNTTTNEELIKYKMVEYNINYMSTEIKVENNLAQVRHLANGFMMIKRVVIEKMGEAFPNTKYTDDIGFLTESENIHAYALFDCGVEDGHYLSEDWLFCHRWTKMGGDIYLNVSIQLSHVGQEIYKGSYIHSVLV